MLKSTFYKLQGLYVCDKFMRRRSECTITPFHHIMQKTFDIRVTLFIQCFTQPTLGFISNLPAKISVSIIIMYAIVKPKQPHKQKNQTTRLLYSAECCKYCLGGGRLNRSPAFVLMWNQHRRVNFLEIDRIHDHLAHPEYTHFSMRSSRYGVT